MNYNNICLGCMQEKGEEKTCPGCGWIEGTEQQSPMYLKPGTILAGKYLIGKVLGHGGFGITYLAYDVNLGFKLAIKEYLPQGMASRNLGNTEVSVYSGNVKEQFEYGLEKFLDEARTIAKFEEVPEIVKIRDFFKDNGTAYIVMNYIEGITLKEYIANNGGRLPLDAVLNIMLPVMKALEQVHKTGILHRDISPDNIYITKSFQVKLLDFGAARFAIGEHSKSLSVVLKPGYAPEEQYRSKGNQGPWTDVYAAAATMYKALTGETPPESLDRLEADSLVPPSALGVEIPASMEAAMIKALKVRASDRYQSMSLFMDGLIGQQGVQNSHTNKGTEEKTVEKNSLTSDKKEEPEPSITPKGGQNGEAVTDKPAAKPNPAVISNNIEKGFQPNKNNKKLIIGIVLGAAAFIGLSVLGVFLLLSQIGSNSGAGNDKPVSENRIMISDFMKSKNLSGSIVVGLNPSEYSYKDKYDQLAQEFMGEFPNTQVSFEQIANTDSEYETKVKLKMAAGELNDLTMIPDEVKNEELPMYFLPLDDLGFSKDNIYTYDSGTFNGTLYKLSPTADFYGILYNKTAFSKAGINDTPLTPEDFYEACAKLKSAGITPVATGYSDRWPLYVWSDIYPYAFSGDPKLKTKQMKTGSYLSGSMLEGINLLRSLKDKGYLEDNLINSDFSHMRDSIKSGSAGMVYSGQWFNSDYDIGMFPSPNSKALPVYPGYFYGVSKNSKAPMVAKAFFKFMLDDDRYTKALNKKDSSVKNSSMKPDYIKELLSFGLPTVDVGADDSKGIEILKKAGLSGSDIAYNYINAIDTQSAVDSMNLQIANANR